jgi:hypothetical protein
MLFMQQILCNQQKIYLINCFIKIMLDRLVFDYARISFVVWFWGDIALLVIAWGIIGIFNLCVFGKFEENPFLFLSLFRKIEENSKLLIERLNNLRKFYENFQKMAPLSMSFLKFHN